MVKIKKGIKIVHEEFRFPKPVLPSKSRTIFLKKVCLLELFTKLMSAMGGSAGRGKGNYSKQCFLVLLSNDNMDAHRYQGEQETDIRRERK